MDKTPDSRPKHWYIHYVLLYIILRACMSAFICIFLLLVFLHIIVLLYYSIVICEALSMGVCIYMDLCQANTILID